jgi:type IV pilus assembly protein PilA
VTIRRPRSRRGLTIIELLVVLVVIGILAAIAIVRWQDSRGRAVDVALQADLRNLVAAQEAHVQTAGAYTADLSRLSFRSSPGVTVRVTAADSAGWAATASHPRARVTACAVYAGRVATPPTPATREGVIACQ